MQSSTTTKNLSILLFISGMGNGGAERVFINLAHGLGSRGHKVTLLVATRKGELANRVENIEFLDSRFALTSLLSYMTYVRRHKPKVVIATLSSAILVSVMSKIFLSLTGSSTRLVLRIANIYQKPTNIFGFLTILIQRLALSYADGIIANSNATLKSVFQVVGVNMGKIPATIIANPVLSDDFKESRFAIRGGITLLEECRSRPTKLLVIGRLVPQKRIDHAIKALSVIVRTHPKAQLIIVGSGPLRGELQTQIEVLGLMGNVEFIPFVQDVPRLLATVDCLISVSLFEGFGNVFIEALAYCKNLVAYKNSGGSSEILPTTRAQLVSDGDFEALARAVISIMQKPSNRPLCSDEELQKYTVSRISGLYLDFLIKLTNNASI